MTNPKKTHIGQHKILVLIVYAPLINEHADVSSKATGLNVGLLIHLSPYFMCEGHPIKNETFFIV